MAISLQICRIDRVRKLLKINWEKAFSDVGLNEEVVFFNKTILRFLSNSYLSTWENCSPCDFDHNIIQNTNILGDAAAISLPSKLLLFTPRLLKRLVL